VAIRSSSEAALVGLPEGFKVLALVIQGRTQEDLDFITQHSHFYPA
jgi:hypothetical protein